MPRDCSLDKASKESSLSFQDDKSKNGNVESVDSSTTSHLKDTVQLIGRTTEQTAPNLIKGRHCQACSKDVQIEKESIQCRLCKDTFHAINCVDNNDHWVSSVTSFTNHILPAIINRRNAKTGKKRPGAFWYICDCCATDNETRAAAIEVDKVVILEQKIESVQNNLRDEISELKNLMIQMCNNSDTQSVDQSSVMSGGSRRESNPNCNVWNDSQRTERLKDTFIKKV